ncbi:hypothetical protein AAFF_G00298520 [Aldrovandia affinis]|uniref:Uncharacterized protein n=1 Tax=Aldrovandia affinis TaxID=143900 RepID=A0AAD7R9A0_9TELE|nr:hypothetical protein AAFF_G00298520 [Aldrovandia affinis]
MMPTEEEGSASAPPAAPRTVSQGKVSPYSVIDIAPLQQQQLPPLPPPPPLILLLSRAGPPFPLPGLRHPDQHPAITPAYTTPVIIRHLSVEDDVTIVRSCNASLDSEEYPVITEEDALSKWVSDPANTAWMDNPDEVIYDDVPRENSDSTTDPEEMIYDDVELGEEGCSSSLDNGWSSSEFESYDEHSEGEGQGRNGLPDAFMRGTNPRSKTHLSEDLSRLKERYERKMRDLMASAVGTVELQQIRQKHEIKMQKLVKAARMGPKTAWRKPELW